MRRFAVQAVEIGKQSASNGGRAALEEAVMAQETFANMGSPIHWARMYDLGTRFMMLGRGNSFRRRVLDLALLKDGEGFLDIGCGPGRLVMEACKRVGRLGAVYGVDLSPQMMHLA